MKHRANIRCVSIKSTNSFGKRKRILALLVLIFFGLFAFGMGPEFSSDIAGDGPRKRNFDEDEFDLELGRTKKKKKLNSRRSKSSIEAYNQSRILKDPRRTETKITLSKILKDPRRTERKITLSSI